MPLSQFSNLSYPAQEETLALDAANLLGGSANAIPYQSGVNTTSFLSQGTGVLQESAGAPSWTTSPALTSPTGTTQAIFDNSTKLATTAFVVNDIERSMSTLPLSGITGGTYSFASLGSGSVIVVGASGGVVTSITSIAVPGSGYAVGDLVSILSGNGDCVLVVTSVSGGGITGVSILYGGTGYNPVSASVGSNPSDTLIYTFTLTGTLTSNATFIMRNGNFLTGSNQWIVNNNTTGAFTVSFFMSNGSNATTGIGIQIPQGTSNSLPTAIQTDGMTDIWYASNVSGAFQASTIKTSGQITSTLSTGTAPFVVSSTTNVANLNASSLNGATFAAPGAIGSTTASTGAFTTLTTSSTAQFGGTIGIGSSSTPVTYEGIRLNLGLSGNTTAWGIICNPAGTSGVTTSLVGISCAPGSAASSYTQTNSIGFLSAPATQGAGSTITNVYGFQANDQTVGGTLNVGYSSQVSSGTGKWNIYANGSAANTFAGPVTIGSSVMPTSAVFQVQGSGLATGTSQYGIYSSPQSNSSATAAGVGIYSYATSAAASYTVTSLIGVQIANNQQGAGSTISNCMGLSLNDQTVGTNNFGIYNSVSSGTGKWGYYGIGTANNAFAGNVIIGSTTAANSQLLTVTGTANLTGVNQYGIVSQMSATSGATTAVFGNWSQVTAAPSATTVNAYDYYAKAIAAGSSGTVTNSYGFYSENQTVGSSANFGYYSNVASATGAWNYYAAGSANNAFAGNVAIGSTSAPTSALVVTGSATVSASLAAGTFTDSNSHLIIKSTAVTIASGFGTSPSIVSNNTAAFAVTVGSSPAGTGVLTFPTASNGWVVNATNITSNSSLVVSQSASSTTSATLTCYSRTTGLAANFNASDVILISAFAY